MKYHITIIALALSVWAGGFAVQAQISPLCNVIENGRQITKPCLGPVTNIFITPTGGIYRCPGGYVLVLDWVYQPRCAKDLITPTLQE